MKELLCLYGKNNNNIFGPNSCETNGIHEVGGGGSAICMSLTRKNPVMSIPQWLVIMHCELQCIH